MYGGTITTFITDTEVGMLEQVFDEMAKLIVCPNLDQKLVDVAAANEPLYDYEDVCNKM